jgi:hypothetical protein
MLGAYIDYAYQPETPIWDRGFSASRKPSLLPRGGAGSYSLGKPFVSAAGAAVIRKDRITALKVKLDISSVKPGDYVLNIGQPGEEANSYPLAVK